MAVNVRLSVRHTGQKTEKILSDYIMLKVRLASITDLCSRKQHWQGDRRVGHDRILAWRSG